MTTTILDEICARKRAHIERKRAVTSQHDLQKLVEKTLPTRGFIKALGNNKPGLIAEVKKASPSRGLIRPSFDPIEIATAYAANGAACLSVLTDEPYFQGKDEDFISVRAHVSIPMLRKDFMLDPYQIYESRAMGADCILLIMAALSDEEADILYRLSSNLGMDILFEVHDEDELNRALSLKPKMVGVNNRNLKTFQVDLGTSLNLAGSMPDGVFKIAESGIEDFETIETLSAAGYGGFLIGESLLRQEDIAAATRNILGR